MSRRTVLWAAMVALAGCQGPNSSMTSAFKLPTPSFNLLAPYGSPRVPPPSTNSYGQPALAGAASAAQPYYPGTNARSVSHPQSPEASGSPAAPSAAQGKVAAAVWKSARSGENEETGSDEASASLASYQGNPEPADEGQPIRIPDESAQPAEPVELKLGGMRAHDLTAAVASPSPTALALASAPVLVQPAPAVIVAATTAPVAASQVVSPAPAATQPAAASTTTTAASTTTASGGQLVEITELPPATTTNPSLQRVRGFDQPAATRESSGAAEVFISPQMTISASTTQATRDAVAAAVLKTEEPPAPTTPAEPATGWKSRYSMDES